MKNTMTFLLILAAFLAAAQPKVVRQTQAALTPDGWKTNYKIEYRYNAQGLLTMQENFILNGNKEWETTNRWSNEYDAAGNLVHNFYYKKFSDSLGIYLQFEREGEYNSDGCIVAGSYRDYLENGEITNFSKLLFFPDANCRYDSIITMICGFVNGVQQCVPQENISYEYSTDGKMVTERFSYWLQQPGVFVQTGHYNVSYFDDNGHVLEKINYANGGYLQRLLYTYHDDGSLATSRFFMLDSLGGWELTYQDSVGYEYEYDDNGFVVRKKKTYFYNNGEFNYALDSRFTNFCDGLPRYEIVNDQTRTTYEYETGIDCGIDKFFTEPEINPNPASDRVLIQYPPLAKGNVTVRVLTTLGSEAIGYKVNYRTYDAEVDVSQLPIGIYFLQMLDGKRKFGRKLMVQR